MEYTRRLKYRPITLQNCVKLCLIFLTDDVATHSGPVANPCGYCVRPVTKTHRAVLCEGCYYWRHIRCAGISLNEHQRNWVNLQILGCAVLVTHFNLQTLFFLRYLYTRFWKQRRKLIHRLKNDLFDSIKQTRREHPNKFLCA